MKRNSIINILLLTMVVALVSCQGEAMNAGASALENEDQIRVKADTFSVVSALKKSSAISFSPDSFLLGGFTDRTATSMEKELGRKIDTEEVKARLLVHFARELNVNKINTKRLCQLTNVG